MLQPGFGCCASAFRRLVCAGGDLLPASGHVVSVDGMVSGGRRDGMDAQRGLRLHSEIALERRSPKRPLRRAYALSIDMPTSRDGRRRIRWARRLTCQVSSDRQVAWAQSVRPEGDIQRLPPSLSRGFQSGARPVGLGRRQGDPDRARISRENGCDERLGGSRERSSLEFQRARRAALNLAITGDEGRVAARVRRAASWAWSMQVL